MSFGAVFVSSADLVGVSVAFVETMVVEMVPTVTVVVLCADPSTTGGATVIRLRWMESACTHSGCSGMVVVGVALVLAGVISGSELLRSLLVWGAGLER